MQKYRFPPRAGWGLAALIASTGHVHASEAMAGLDSTYAGPSRLTGKMSVQAAAPGLGFVAGGRTARNDDIDLRFTLDASGHAALVALAPTVLPLLPADETARTFADAHVVQAATRRRADGGLDVDITGSAERESPAQADAPVPPRIVALDVVPGQRSDFSELTGLRHAASFTLAEAADAPSFAATVDPQPVAAPSRVDDYDGVLLGDLSARPAFAPGEPFGLVGRGLFASRDMRPLHALPEPASAALLGLGVLMLVARRRWSRQRQDRAAGD